MAKLHGKTAKAKINGVDCICKSWDATKSSNIHDTTSTASGGWRERTPGVREMTGSITIEMDSIYHLGSSGNPFIEDGTLIELELYIDATSYFDLSAYTSDCAYSIDVDSPIELTIDWESTGQVDYVTS